MGIRNAKPEDIKFVAELEKMIEKENAASEETLLSRFKMFPTGFYVAEENGKILGYAESCLWNKKDFEIFNEIKDFPNHHNPNGRNLYVIFLGVNEAYRKKGIGSSLIRTLQKYAYERQLDKVQLVAGDGFLIGFYQNLGFETVKKLPNFLPYGKWTLMEYVIK